MAQRNICLTSQDDDNFADTINENDISQVISNVLQLHIENHKIKTETRVPVIDACLWLIMFCKSLLRYIGRFCQSRGESPFPGSLIVTDELAEPLCYAVLEVTPARKAHQRTRKETGEEDAWFRPK